MGQPRHDSSNLLLLLACGAAFLAILDVTVVNLAIPSMLSDYRGATIAGLTWVITLYAIVLAALLAPMGRIADVVGRRRLFATGVAGFALASLLCALAPSVAVLLLARALQGAAAAAMLPASLAVVLADTPIGSRARAIAIWTAAGAFAAAVGPSLGGVLVDAFGWRSLFLINVPTGLALALLAAGVPSAPSRSAALPDWLGTLLLAGGVGALAFALSRGAVWGWGDARTLACLLGGAAALAATLARSARRPVPAVEISLWRSRTYARANLASLLYGAAMYSAFLLNVLVLTELWHYSVLEAGFVLTPGAIAATVAALLAGRLRGRGGPRTAVVLGAALAGAAALASVLALPQTPSLSFWLPVTVVFGAGMGMGITGITTAASLSVAAERFAAATGLNQTARQVGGVLGIATVATLLARQQTGVAELAHAYLVIAIALVVGGIAGLGLRLGREPVKRRGAPDGPAPRSHPPVADAARAAVVGGPGLSQPTAAGTVAPAAPYRST
jgi:EmrB/QacA subfamily drug resistance transporter